jgi:hypothetical protein
MGAYKWNFSLNSLLSRTATRRDKSMRSLILWAVGIPLPIILILWLVTGHA